MTKDEEARKRIIAEYRQTVGQLLQLKEQEEARAAWRERKIQTISDEIAEMSAVIKHLEGIR